MFANGSDNNALFIDEQFILSNNRTNDGTYCCKASNGIWNDVNHTVNVVVDCEYVKYVQYFGYLEDHCLKLWATFLLFKCIVQTKLIQIINNEHCNLRLEKTSLVQFWAIYYFDQS